jgi:hypothetical protein
MVLQRNKPVNIWGESRKPQTMRVFINGSVAASAQAVDGIWKITLPVMEASRGLTIKITGENEAEQKTEGGG